MPNERQIVAKVKKVIGNPKGKCYAASEALYHLLGGRAEGYIPKFIRLVDETHWWLTNSHGKVIDVTADQYDFPVAYDRGKGCGFLTSRPSKRAQEIIDATGISSI